MLCTIRVKFVFRLALHNAHCIWKDWALLKCIIYIWLAIQYRAYTSDRRFWHGLQDITTLCFTCYQEEDNLDHTLMQCVYALPAWHGCFTSLAVHIAIPSVEANLEVWWLRSCKGSITKDEQKELWFTSHFHCLDLVEAKKCEGV